MSKIFPHPNMLGFKCPICDKSDDYPVILIRINGTKNGGLMEGEQVHLSCLLDGLIYYKDEAVIAVKTNP